MPKVRPKSRRDVVKVRMRPEFIVALDLLAKRRNLNRSEYVRALVTEDMERVDLEEAERPGD